MSMDIITNFKVLSPIPVDSRFVFDTYSGMVEYFTIHTSWIYEGLITYAKDLKNVYVYTDATWKKIATDDILVYNKGIERTSDNYVNVLVDGSSIKINDDNQLEAIFNDHFLGFFPASTSLPATASMGDYCYVDSIIWVWDSSSYVWVDTGEVGAGVFSITTENGGTEAGNVILTASKIGAMPATTKLAGTTDDITNSSTVSGATLTEALQYLSTHSIWGGITGSISNQADLQALLDSKVPQTRKINGNALTSDITLDIPESFGDLSGTADVMLKTIYDSDGDGVVDRSEVAESLDGIDSASSNQYYGKDSTGAIGFHTVESLVGSIHWGYIYGAITDQTDLNVILNKKVPTTRTINGLSLETDIILDIPTYLSDLTSDSLHRTVTDTEIASWNSKYGSLSDLPYTPENAANKGTPSGYAPLDASGKIPSTYLNSVAITTVTVATSFPTIAVSGQVCIRSDLSVTYIYDGTQWLELPVPTGNFVETVNGYSGPYVTITKSDLGLSNVTNDEQAISSGSSSISGQIVTWGSTDGRTLGTKGYSVVYDVSSDPSHSNIPTELAVYAAIKSQEVVNDIVTKNGGSEHGIVTITPEKIGAMSEDAAIGDMFKEVYDPDNDGFVEHADTASKIYGVDLADFNQYYGTDKYGNVGFHTINIEEFPTVYWSDIVSKPTFANVAYTGVYSDLLEKPTIPSKLSELLSDATHTTVTEQDIANWNNKQAYLEYTPENIANKGIANGYAPLDANVKIPSDYLYDDLPITWESIIGKPTFATVSTTGSYSDLSNKPIIPDELKDLISDIDHRTVSDEEINAWNSKQDYLGYTPENIANKGIANGYVPLDSNIKIQSQYLPAITVVDVVVGTEFPTSAVTGEVFINVSTSKTWIYDGSEWFEMLTTPSVTSVNGKTGVVEINKSDIGLSNVTNDAQIIAPDTVTVGSIPTWKSVNELNGIGYEISNVIGESPSTSRVTTETSVYNFVEDKINNISPTLSTITVGTAFPLLPKRGDICIRSDETLTYVYDGNNWQLLLSEVDFVKSVNGHQGTHINVTKSDIGLSNVSNNLQINAPTNAVIRTIPTWISNTSLDGNGYSISDVLDSVSTHSVPTSKAVYDAILEYAPVTCLISEVSSTSDCAVKSSTLYAYLEGGSSIITGQETIVYPGKVDKVEGKQLSDQNYTLDEKVKLASIKPYAEQNVQANWYESDNLSDAYILNKPATVSSIRYGFLPAFGSNLGKVPYVKEDGSGIGYKDVTLTASNVSYTDVTGLFERNSANPYYAYDYTVQKAIELLDYTKVTNTLQQGYGWIGNEYGYAEAMQVATVPPWISGKVLLSTNIAGVFKWADGGSGGNYVGFYSTAGDLPTASITDGAYAIVGSTTTPYTMYVYKASSSEWQNIGGAGDELINYMRRDGSNSPTANISWNNKRLIDLADPVNSNDSVNLSYLNNTIASGYYKVPVEKVVTSLPTIMSSGSKVAMGNGRIYTSNGTNWIQTFDAREGNVAYCKETKVIHVWNGSAWARMPVTTAAGSAIMSSGTVSLVDDWYINSADNTFRIKNYPGASDFLDVTNKKDLVRSLENQAFANQVDIIENPSNVIIRSQQSVGFRYINMTDQKIYYRFQSVNEDDTDWIISEPEKGTAVFCKELNAYEWFNGSSWERIENALSATMFDFSSITIDHNQTTNGGVGDPHTQYLLANGTRAMSGNLNAGYKKITNLQDGVNDNDAATMKQFRMAVTGISWPYAAVVGFYNTPPIGSSVPRAIVGPNPTGVFISYSNYIAAWNINTSTWEFTNPSSSTGILCTDNGEEVNGVYLNKANEQYIYNGTSWVLYMSGSLHDTLPDAANSVIHANYIRNNIDQDITKTFTFNPDSSDCPFLVDSDKRTVVSNLNAEMVGGLKPYSTNTISSIVARDANGNINTSGVTTGQIIVSNYNSFSQFITTSSVVGTINPIINTLLTISPSDVTGTKKLNISGYTNAYIDDSPIVTESSSIWSNYITHTSFPFDISGITTNQVIAWDGSKFIPTAHNEVSSLSHHMLADPDLYDDHPKYLTVERFHYVHDFPTYHTLGDIVPHDNFASLLDTNITSPESNQIVKYVDGKWTNGYLSGSTFDHDSMIGVANSTAHLKYPLLDGTRMFTGNLSIGSISATNLYLNMQISLGQFSIIKAVNHGSWGETLGGWVYYGTHEFSITNSNHKLQFGNVNGTFDGFNINVNNTSALYGNIGTKVLQFGGYDVFHKGMDRVDGTTPASDATVGGAIRGLNAQYIQGKTLDDITIGGSIYHGALRELHYFEGTTTETDHHPQYLNIERHDLVDRHTLGSVVPHDNIANLYGVSINSGTLVSKQVLMYNVSTGLWENKNISSTLVDTDVTDITDGRYIRADIDTTVSNHITLTGAQFNLGSTQSPIYVTLPFKVSSHMDTIPNLDVEYLGGYTAADFVKLSTTNTFTNTNTFSSKVVASTELMIPYKDTATDNYEVFINSGGFLSYKFNGTVYTLATRGGNLEGTTNGCFAIESDASTHISLCNNTGKLLVTNELGNRADIQVLNIYSGDNRVVRTSNSISYLENITIDGNNSIIQSKRFNSSTTPATTIVPAVGELTIDTYTGEFKIGDGTHNYSTLSSPYLGSGGTASDSNKLGGYTIDHFATLDTDGKVLTSQLPDSLLGALKYKGTFDASTTEYPATNPTLGDYYVCATAGVINTIDYQVGDWIVYDTNWDKIDNSDKVSSVNGQVGVVSLTANDVGALSTSGTAADSIKWNGYTLPSPIAGYYLHFKSDGTGFDFATASTSGGSSSSMTIPYTRATEGNISTITTYLPVVVPNTATLHSIQGSLLAAPSGSDVLIDVRKNDTSTTSASVFTNYQPFTLKQTVSTTYRSRSSYVVTLTMASHGFATGDVVTVSGVGGTSYNGTFTLTAVSTTTISYADNAADESSTADTGGLVEIVKTNGIYQSTTGDTNQTTLNSSVTSLSKGDVLWIMVTQVGSSTPGSGLQVTINLTISS